MHTADYQRETGQIAAQRHAGAIDAGAAVLQYLVRAPVDPGPGGLVGFAALQVGGGRHLLDVGESQHERAHRREDDEQENRRDDGEAAFSDHGVLLT